VRRDLNLNEPARLKADVFALRQFEHEFFNERGHVAIGTDGAFPLLALEDFGGDIDAQVLFDGDLTREAITFTGLAVIDVVSLGRQNVPAPFADLDHTLCTSPAAAAGRRDIDLMSRQCAQQFSPGGNRNGFLIVDENIDVARSDQLPLRKQNQHHQHQDNSGEHADAEKYFRHGELSRGQRSEIRGRGSDYGSEFLTSKRKVKESCGPVHFPDPWSLIPNSQLKCPRTT